MSLIPLGVSMWIAHLLFHLSIGWRTVWPVFQRAAGDIGFVSQLPDWSSKPLFAPGTLTAIQVLLLDGGLISSLYFIWHSARAKTVVPWAIAAAGLYAMGVWVILQPMQMRGMIHG